MFFRRLRRNRRLRNRVWLYPPRRGTYPRTARPLRAPLPPIPPLTPRGFLRRQRRFLRRARRARNW